MARGIAWAASFGGRATTAGWFSYRRITVAICLANFVAALLVLRSLTSFAPAPKREAPALATPRRAHDSGATYPRSDSVQLFFKVKKLRKVFAREEKRRKELPVELKLRVLY
ncbi:hypothetical protein ZWY2020_057591 [Hordeum vulgare]|nr:hypothetical protein ZWY2020_057591 [Hordeum vulgare]